MFRGDGDGVDASEAGNAAVGQHRLTTDNDLQSWLKVRRIIVQATYARKSGSRDACLSGESGGTLLTRAMRAKIAASVMTVVEMPAFASACAIACPSSEGAISDTTTSNLRFLRATSMRK